MAYETKIITPWIGVKELCVYMGVSKETVYRWVYRKKIPMHRVGKLWKFNTKEIDKWIKSGKAKL